MDPWLGEIFALALGVSMDAVAVAAARGLAAPRIRVRDVAVVALLFGGFQAMMPAVGAWLGSHLGASFAAWDHWIAWTLLCGLGAKMLWEAWHADKSVAAVRDPFAIRGLLVLAIATSIDALAVGVTLPIIGAPLLPSLAIIGITTAVLSAAGVLVGRRLGRALGPRLDAVGGLVLVAVGTKILVEHLGR